MPEGPEVAVVADRIRKRISDNRFKKIEVVEHTDTLHRFSKHPIANLSEFQDFKIAAVTSIGKLLVMKLERPTAYVLNTLGMSGTWKWNGRDHKHARLNFIGYEDLTFIDPRCFGSFKIVGEEEFRKRLKRAGRDLLTEPVPELEWESFQRHKSIRNMEIGPALMTQHLFCGIGNIYKSEILYECRLDPCTRVKDIPKDRWMKINSAAHRILVAAYLKKGTTIRTFEADGHRGKNQSCLKIYGKKSVREGLVATINQMGRKTYFCPLRVSP